MYGVDTVEIRRMAEFGKLVGKRPGPPSQKGGLPTVVIYAKP
jgi:hypothetical protein